MSQFSARLAALVVACHAFSTYGTPVYVDTDASGPVHDGLTWCTAYIDLQEAFTEAAADPTITEIRVAEGTYLPDDSIPPNGRDATFPMKNGLAFLGGFAGCGEADPDVRDSSLYETILTGDRNGDDGPDFANNDENAWHIVTATNVNNTAVIDGFTFSHGNAFDGNTFVGERDRGAGLYGTQSSVIVRNCTFSDNHSMRGAAYIRGGSPSFVDCTFLDNHADRTGGGLSLHNVTAAVTRCSFVGNLSYSPSEDGPATAHGNGGGFHCAGSTITATDCFFTQNSALGWGDSSLNSPTAGNGAALLVFNSGGTFTNCRFIDNTAEAYGAGVLNQNGSNPTFINCYFDNNKVLGTEWWEPAGAAINNWFCSPTFVDCVITNHTSTHGHGGGIHSHNATNIFIRCSITNNHALIDAGGGAYLAESDSTFLQCIFANNTGTRGAGIYMLGDALAVFVDCLFTDNVADNIAGAVFVASGMSADFINCTITQNTAVSSNTGGVYHLSNGHLNIENSVVYGNTDNLGQFQNGQVRILLGTHDINYSNIQNLLPSLGGVGNFDADPLFLDAVAGNYRISALSPCVNTGDPSMTTSGDAVDLDGHPRKLCDRIDVGAYEYGMADADCDLDVDLGDYAEWQNCVTGPGVVADDGCAMFDFNADRDVDLDDYRSFQLAFSLP